MEQDFIPDASFVPDSPIKKNDSAKQGSDQDFISDEEFQSDEDKTGGSGLTALGLGEKFAQGIIGPLAPMAEVGINKAAASGALSGLPGALGAGLQALAPEMTPEKIRERTEQAGGLGTVAEMTGFGVGMFLPLGYAGALGKIGEGAKVAAGLGEASGLAAKMAAGAIKGTAEMAALGGGEELTRLIEKDPDQTATSAIAHVGMSAALGTAFGAGFAAVPPLWMATAGPTVEKILGKIKSDWGIGNPSEQEMQIVSPVVKNLLNTFGGVDQEVMEKYAADRAAINNAPEFHDLYSHVLDEVLDRQENLLIKKETFSSAKSKFSDFMNEQKLALRQAGYDAGAADTMASAALKEAQTKVALSLQDSALSSAPRAFSGVQKLKDEAIALSQGARDILDKTPGELSLKPIFEAVKPMQDKLYSLGFPERAEALGQQMDIFAHQYGDRLGYSDAKSMIQGLQQRGKWNFGANEMSNGLSPYFNELSGIMNEGLKDAVPAYREAMKPTAEAFELLGKLNKYGTPESANKAVLGLKNPANYASELPLLKALEMKSGVNFVGDLEQYASPHLRDSMIKALPEYESAQRTAEALRALKDPETQAAMQRSVYLSSAYRQMENAEKSLEQQVEIMSKTKGLTPATIESKMKAVMAGKSIAGKGVLEHIPGLDGLSIPELLNMIHVRESFEKGSMHGSRNVNLWAKMVGSLGGLIGGLATHGVEGGAIGAGAGAYIGAILDKNGPAFVKDLLDKYLDKYGDLPKMTGASPEATKAALIHFLSSGKEPSAKAFKSTVNYMNAAKMGTKILKNSARAIFEGSKVLPPNLFPDIEKTKKLDEKAKKLQSKQVQMFSVGGEVGDYLPSHGEALAKISMNATNHINQSRPDSQKSAFLDEEVEPTSQQINEHDRNLQIAQQPLVVFNHIKNNTLIPQDIQSLKSLYPDYYGHMSQSIMDAMADHVSDGGKIPYQLRQSLSAFMGHPLDSSFSQSNIMAAQNSFSYQKSQAAPQGMMGGGKSVKKLGSAHSQYQTMEQSARARQTNKG